MSKEHLEALLTSLDEDVRLDGLRQLAAGEPASSLELLFAAFGDPSWRVRKAATDLFLALPVSRQLVGRLIELLHAGENAGLRNAAVDMLVRMGGDAVPMLLEQANCFDHDVRKFIIDILGEIGDLRAIPVLLAALVDDDGNVRAAAAENLGKLRAAEAVPALLDAMQCPDILLRFAILDALGRIGITIPLAKLLPFRDEKLLRKALVECLGRVGDVEAAGELLAGLTDPMRNVRDASLLGLVAIAERYPEEIRTFLASRDFSATAEIILTYLDDGSDRDKRLAAIRVLGWLAEPRAVKPLLALLPDEELQQDLLFALIHIGTVHPRALLDVWSQATDLERAYLAWVYGESGCVAATSLLAAVLGGTDARLTQMAAHALGRIGGVAELPPLVASLQHADADVRDAAIQALGALGQRFPTELLAALEPIFNDAEPMRRSAAITVLGRLTDQAVIAHRLAMALKDPASEVRRAALRALNCVAATDHWLAIQLALTDEDAEVRRLAAEVLGACGSPDAVDSLRLTLGDEDLWVRVAALRSLGRLGGAAESQTIAGMLGDPVGLVCISALETLTELLGAEACPQLFAACAHADDDVVHAALNLLERHGHDGWLQNHIRELVDHPAPAVRGYGLRLLAEQNSAAVRPILEERLAVEQDETLLRQLRDLLDGLTKS
jgi:HEAT repeat protein